MKICVIGAGWFGCHIATKLIDEGHSVKIFEKNKKFLVMLRETIKIDFIKDFIILDLKNDQFVPQRFCLV